MILRRSAAQGAFAAAAVWLLLLPAVHGTVNSYENEKLDSNYLLYRKAAMYSMEDAPSVSGSEHTRAAVEVQLTFDFNDAEKRTKDPQIQVTFMPEESFPYLGVKPDPSMLEEGEDPNGRVYCCTEDLAKDRELCAVENTLIFDKSPTPITTMNVFPDLDGTTRFSKSFDIPRKGYYYLIISFCNPVEEIVEISGLTRWVNPFGYLPGELYGFLNFYFNLSVLHLLTALVWAYLCGRYWRDLLMLQNLITVVIAFGLIEVYLRYYDLHHFNYYGTRSKFFLHSSFFFLCLKKAVSRVLVLVVSMGFGMVKPTLGDNANKVMMLGILFFACSYLQLTVRNASHTHSLTVLGYLFELPVTCIDLIFFVWTFKSLNTIIASLKTRRQDNKRNLYIAFRGVLIAAGVVGTVWSLFFAYAVVNNWMETHWEKFYLLEGFWDILYYAIIVCIMYLWVPSSNSKRYSYNSVPQFDHDQEEYGDELEDVSSSKK